MKRFRFTSLLLVIFLLVQVCSYNVLPVSASENHRYGYSCLKSDSQRYAYETLVAGIRGFQSNIPLDQAKKLTADDLVYVRDMIYADYPEFFWFAGSYDYSHLDGTAVAFMPHYRLNIGGEDVTEANQQMLKAVYQVETAARTVTDPIKNMTDPEKALYLYEYVAKTMVYESTANDQNLYGAMIEGKGVCSAYARMYQYLLLKAGIRAWWVSGEAVNSKGVRENHAWTVLWLDGKCYCADITWDDGKDKLFHAYFLKSIEALHENHFPREPYAQALPQQCGHTDQSYYTVYAGKIDGLGIADRITSADELAAVFRPVSLTNTEAVYCATIHYTGSDFSGWFQDVSQNAILKKLNLKSGKISWSYLGDEYQIILSGTPASFEEVSAESIRLLTEQVSLGFVGQRYWIGGELLPVSASNRKLQYVSSDPKIAAVDPETGIVTAVSDGTAYISVLCRDPRITAVCAVTVTQEPDHFHDAVLETVAKLEPGCTEKGSVEHYQCNGCKGLFLDPEGFMPVSDPGTLVIQPLGHRESEWKYTKTEHFKVCTHADCGAEIAGSRGGHTGDTCGVCGYRKGDPVSELPTNSVLPDTETLIKIGGGLVAAVAAVIVLGKLFRRRK